LPRSVEPEIAAPGVSSIAASASMAPLMPSEKPKLSTNTEKPLEYTVREGDKLEDIAKRYLVRAEDISAMNDLAGVELRPGQQLLIPTGDF